MKDYKTIQEVRDCEELNEIEKVQIEFHANDFYGLKTALQNYNEIEIYEGSAIDYATDLFNECYEFNESVAPFIDYKSFCNDLIIGGDIYEFNHKYLIINKNYI